MQLILCQPVPLPTFSEPPVCPSLYDGGPSFSLAQRSHPHVVVKVTLGLNLLPAQRSSLAHPGLSGCKMIFTSIKKDLGPQINSLIPYFFSHS